MVTGKKMNGDSVVALELRSWESNARVGEPAIVQADFVMTAILNRQHEFYTATQDPRNGLWETGSSLELTFRSVPWGPAEGSLDDLPNIL